MNLWRRAPTIALASAGAIVLAIATVTGEKPLAAADLFEIQVFHSIVNAPRQLSLELHDNYVPIGASASPRAPELPTGRVLFQNLEPVIGLLSGWEVGLHLQEAIRPTGDVAWGGWRLRTMVRAPALDSVPLVLAVNLEGGYLPATYDPARWGSELRPILELLPGNWDIDFNPVLSFAWTGPDVGVPRLEPAFSVRYAIPRIAAPGLEYYGFYGPVSNLTFGDRAAQYLFGTVDVIRWPRLIAHVGVGKGLTVVSSSLVATSIVGYRF